MLAIVPKRIAATAKRPWSLQYASGLYADLNWKRAIAALKPTGRHLALLGNCGSVATVGQRNNTAAFLQRCSEMWNSVLWVPGPHEFVAAPGKQTLFTEQMDRIYDMVGSIPGKDRIKVLQHAELPFYDEQVVVLGATGWTDAVGLERLPAGAPEGTAIWTGKEGVPRPLGLADIRTWNRQDMHWIHRQMAAWTLSHPHFRKVILTHHLFSPVFQNMPLPTDLHERRGLDCMSSAALGSMYRMEHPLGPTAWLCGGGGAATSGFVSYPTRLFAGVNCYAPWVAAAALGKGLNPAYMPNRVMELSVPAAPAAGARASS